MNPIDWSSLTPDLLHDICTKLAEIIYVIHFRAVCKTWRSSFSLSEPSTFLPWILVYESPIRTEDLQFYSPFSIKTYNVHVPQAMGKRLMGPAKGYLLGYKYSDVSLTLLNPFTASEISLPPLQEKISCPLNVFITPEEKENKIIILGTENRDSQTLSLGISRPGKLHWVITGLDTINRKYGACAFYNDMCFLSELSEGHTTCFSAITGNFVSKIPNFKKRTGEEALEYLVVSGGKLLRIVINNYKNTEQLFLDVFELNDMNGYKWFEINDIDDHVLFLDRYDSFSMSSRELHGLKGNCIYFFTHRVLVNNEGEKRCLLHRYELGNGNIQTLQFPFMRCGTWIIPSMCNRLYLES